MRDEYVFPIDKVTRKGVVCIIQGVKYRDDPSQKTRLTILGGGLEYRLEGEMTDIQAVRLSTFVPNPHAGIHGVHATVESRSPFDWHLTVVHAYPGTRVVEGATYEAEFFGMAAPIAEPDEDASFGMRR